MPPLWREKGKKRFMGNGDEEVEVKNDPRRSEGECLLPFSTFFPFFFDAGEFPFELSLLVSGPGRRGERGTGGECASF